MPLRILDDSGYSGMVRDESSMLLAKGQVYDALNLLFDQPGVARLRGGSTAIFSGAQTAFATSIGFVYAQDGTVIEELYGLDGKAGGLNAINKTTGALTSMGTPGTAGSIVGRPVRHFGFLIFPTKTPTGLRPSISTAGPTNSTGFVNTVATSVVAGQQQITLVAADTTTNVKVGASISIVGTAPTAVYYGRVVSIDSGTKFTVWPTPSLAMTVAIGALVTNPSLITTAAGLCAASFQNRLLYGNTVDLSSSGTSLITDHRVYYSPLPTESGFTSGSTQVTGAVFQSTQFWPVFNFFEVPAGSDPIVAMEPIDDNRLLILTTTDVVIFAGSLVTQLSTTSTSVTWDVYPLGTTSGCLSDLSVHRTPIGIMWAGVDGVFAYWPPLRRSPAHTGIRNLMEGKIRNYWYSLQSSGTSFAIHGSAYVRGHYVISGKDGTGATFALAYCLATESWTRLSGAGTDIFFGVIRPSNPTQVFVARWWDQSGAAPSMTNGQVARLDAIADLYTAGATKTDSDGSAVSFSITSRVLAGDPETQKIFARATARYQAAMPGANATFTGQSKIDASDIVSQSVRSFGSLSNTESRTITTATNATPIVCTTSVVHGLQTGDYVDINGATGNTHANGRWRVTVTSTTVFELLNSSGNGAYGASSARVKKLTESDYQVNTLDAGQGVSFTIASSGTVNNFELHGLRIAYFERAAPVVSA